MAISKIIYQDSSDELLRAVEAAGECMTSLIDWEHGGIKQASSDMVSKKLLEKYKPTNEKTACIHLIAMGDSDMYGYNRNGDYFAGDVLQKRAHTFVTNSHVFREHRNKDPKKAIGSVKWAGYDPNGMHRVELIVHLDKDKAEEEYEMAKKGEDLNFSMSCRVPNDRCSICGNKAKNVGAYCDHLKKNMGKYDEKMKKYAFAYNDEPTFFDISRVKTPADRIARHLEYSFADGVKAASFQENGALMPSAYAAAAEGINLDMFELDEMNMLNRLADAEEYANDMQKAANLYTDLRAYASQFIYPHALMEKFSSVNLDVARRMSPERFFREMAKRACLLSFPAFCQYISGETDVEEDPMYKEACCHMPKVFRVMRIKITRMVPSTSHFRMGSEFRSHCDRNCREDEIARMMDQAESDFSMIQPKVQERVMFRPHELKKNHKKEHKSDKDTQEKAASLAELYGQYQLRALCDMQELYGSHSDNVYDFVAGANMGASFNY